MAKTKELRRERYGKVAVVETKYLETKLKRYQTQCRRQQVPKHQQRVDHESWEAAIDYAVKLDRAIDKGKIKEFEVVENFELKKIAEEFRTDKLLSGDYEKTKPLWVTYVENETTLRDVFECGKLAIEAIYKINTTRQQGGLRSFSFLEIFSQFETYANEQSKKYVAPRIGELIDRMINFKTSANGGKGNVELQEVTKRDWREKLGNLKLWIGHFSVEEEGKFLRRKVVERINEEKNKSGKHKGNLWSQVHRKKHATKAKEFGDWLVDEEHWEKNHFRKLAEEYALRRSTSSETLTVEQVDSLFRVAMEKENQLMIPYLALAFFAGCRPQELADPNNANRRFSWSQMQDWKLASRVTNGNLLKIYVFDKQGNRISKGSKDRMADLTPNGVEWIRWWREQNSSKELPLKGSIPYSRRAYDRIKDKALEKTWHPDVARHTFASNAHQNLNFAVDESYWYRMIGHDKKTYDDHYKDTKIPEECERYFAITPSKLKSSKNNQK